jgi:hypothetical protein
MHFQMKNILKNNYNHTLKYPDMSGIIRYSIRQSSLVVDSCFEDQGHI